MALGETYVLPKAWFVCALSSELSRVPLRRLLQGTPLVLFRGVDGRPAAFVDRCPHRGVPLSRGSVVSGELECAYHGWRFSPDGECRAVPGLCGEVSASSRKAVCHAAAERDGFIWVYAAPGEVPRSQPPRFPLMSDDRYQSIRRVLTARGSLHATLENALDVPHTAFLHGGLFRTAKKRHEIEVIVRSGPLGAEAEYRGEPRPPGVLGRLLAPGGGVVEHFDRFLLPSIAQVEYRLGDKSHLVATTPMTPEGPDSTRLYPVVTFRLPVPGWLVRPFVAPIVLRIFAQDAEILALQAESAERFAGASYVSTEIDVLGLQIARLLRHQSQHGDGPAPPSHEHRLRMRV